jgi:hypothetical protein
MNMKTNEATGFTREYRHGKDNKMVMVTEPKSQHNRRIDTGKGSNIRPAIPGGVTYTEETPKMEARREALEKFWAEREAARQEEE